MPSEIEHLLDVDDVAAIYNVSPRTVEGWIRRSVGPVSIKTPGGERRFSRDAVKADLAARGLQWPTMDATETSAA